LGGDNLFGVNNQLEGNQLEVNIQFGKNPILETHLTMGGKNVLENLKGIYSGLWYLGVPNTSLGQPNLARISPQGDFPTQLVNPIFPTPQATQPYMGMPSGFNMLSQPMYGPTGTLMLHLYYQYS
jgi:hypothetical protein